MNANSAAASLTHTNTVNLLKRDFIVRLSSEYSHLASSKSPKHLSKSKIKINKINILIEFSFDQALFDKLRVTLVREHQPKHINLSDFDSKCLETLYKVSMKIFIN